MNNRKKKRKGKKPIKKYYLRKDVGSKVKLKRLIIVRDVGTKRVLMEVDNLNLPGYERS